MTAKAHESMRKYTYTDYMAWPEGERFELIEGVAYAMSPSPSWSHQKLLGELYALLRGFLKGGPCTPIVAPMDVKFSEHTVVQPDITVWCNKENTGEKDTSMDRMPQAPSNAQKLLTVVVEILSPSNPTHDLIHKLRLYEAHGIPEYWIVDIKDKLIIRNRLQNSRYLADYFEAGSFKSEALPGFSFDIGELFAEA